MSTCARGSRSQSRSSTPSAEVQRDNSSTPQTEAFEDLQQQWLVMQQQMQQLLAAQLQGTNPQPAEQPLQEGHPPSPAPLGLRVDTAPRTAALPAWAHSRELITTLARDTCEGQSGIRAENVLAAQNWLEAHPVHPNQVRRVGPQANPPHEAATPSRPRGSRHTRLGELGDDDLR
eukprot:scaffold122249_cov33-Phaeocystis_antarctica.AAC.1